jgi:SAM-dependent methyltransferase
MREIPFEDGAFDGVTSFFTSFGYFREPLDDRRVLQEMGRVVRRGGSFMLDFLNADRVLRELVPEDMREIDGKRIIQRREILDGCVIKRIRIESTTDGSASDFEERVRLYSRAELTALLEEAGLEISHRFGDYEGDTFRSTSPRLILAGHVTGLPEAAR